MAGERESESVRLQEYVKRKGIMVTLGVQMEIGRIDAYTGLM